MKKIVFILLLISYFSFSQEESAPERPNEGKSIDISVRVTKKSSPSPTSRAVGGMDKNRTSSSSSKKGSKKKSTSFISDAQLETEILDELNYYITYSNLPTYLVHQIGMTTEIVGLELIDIWEEPSKVNPNMINDSNSLNIFNGKGEFNNDLEHSLSKTKSKKYDNLKKKNVNYKNFLNAKEQQRQNLERLNYLPNYNPTDLKYRAEYVSQNGKNVFNKIRFDHQRGYGPRVSVESIDAMELFFHTNVSLAQKIMNPYSSSHYLVKEEYGISTNELSLELLNTAENVIAFITGMNNGVKTQIVEYGELYKTVETAITYSIDEPEKALSLAWDLIKNFNPQAILMAYLNNKAQIIKVLNNGTLIEQGEVIGKFATETLLMNIGSVATAFTKSHAIHLNKVGREFAQEFRDIIGNEIGGIKLTKAELLKKIPRKLHKNFDELKFTQKSLNSHIKEKGKFFNLTSNEINSSNTKAWIKKISEHIKNKSTIGLAGTRFDKNPENIFVYYNHKTAVMVMTDTNNNFISGWKLNTRQQRIFLKNHHIADLLPSEK